MYAVIRRQPGSWYQDGFQRWTLLTVTVQPLAAGTFLPMPGIGLGFGVGDGLAVGAGVDVGDGVHAGA